MYLLQDILRDTIDAAKETGIWQLLSLEEKEELVSYFLRHFSAILEESKSAA